MSSTTPDVKTGQQQPNSAVPESTVLSAVDNDFSHEHVLSNRSLSSGNWRIIQFLMGLGGFLILLVVWQILATRGQINPVLLPPPGEVLAAALEMARKGLLLEDLLASLKRVAYGFGVATTLGVSLGVFLGASKWFSALLYPLMEALRPIPPIAWIPLAILWFGIGDSPSYFIVAIGAFFPIFVNAYTGIQEVNRRYIEAARCLGAPQRMIILEVILPAALPFILTGLRVGLGIAWMAVVAAELVAARSGLGYMIQLNRSLLETANVIVGMALVGLVGFIMSTILKRLQDTLTPWRETWEGKS